MDIIKSVNTIHREKEIESMKNKSIKRFMAAAICGVALMGQVVTMQAATTTFTLTVNDDGVNEDNISKRTEKNGGNGMENRYYVTPTSFEGVGYMGVTSIDLKTKKITSYEMVFSTTDPVNYTRYASYKQQAPGDEFYFLKARNAGSATYSTNMKGRYTP